jgi:phosphinothricin acetyltransferase
VRAARREDAAAIASISSAGIAGWMATFELSRIFPANAASRALCRCHGFREVGAYARHGRLDGAWRDVVIVERLLGEAPAEAARP